MLAASTRSSSTSRTSASRYYTYLTTLVYVMEEAARRGIPVIVLDRPNPITGRVVEGPLMDPDLALVHGAAPDPRAHRA